MKTTRNTMVRTIAAVLVLALALGVAPAQDAGPPVTGSAELEGRVLRADGKTPVENAIVRACYLKDGTSVSAPPTDGKGEFSMDGLLSGYADVAVETPDGVFVVNQVIQFLPNKRQVVDLVLTRYSERPAEWWGTQERRQIPCSSAESIGAADARTSASAGSFFKSGAGIAVLAGAGALLLIAAAASGGDDETPASPTQP